MSEFSSFFQLGFAHIVSVSALDHILFLLALAVVYRARDWREALLVVSAFTVGHSITLGLAVTDTVAVNTKVVEFLIPLTIVITAVENLWVQRALPTSIARRYRPLLAGIFGLVHGAGFAGYLKSLFLDAIAVPLLGFNVGIEAGQIVVLAALAILLSMLDAALRRARDVNGRLSAFPVLQLRVVSLSVMIALVASVWTVERRPW